MQDKLSGDVCKRDLITYGRCQTWAWQFFAHKMGLDTIINR